MTDITHAIILCRRFEGFREKPYLCPAGFPTIGLGSRFYEDGTPVKMSDPPIDQFRAEQMLTHQLTHEYLPGVLRLCPGIEANNQALNAVLSWTYNLGISRLEGSTLRKAVNVQDWQWAAMEMKRWTMGGGRVLPGLVARRAAEASLLLRA